MCLRIVWFLAQGIFNDQLVSLYVVKADAVEDVGSDIGHTDVELGLAQKTGRAKQP